MNRNLLLSLFIVLWASHAAAQGVTRVCTQSIGANGSNNCTDVGPTNAFPIQGIVGGVAVPVTGTFSATLGGFAPTPSYTVPLSVTTVSSNVALPVGVVAVVYNTGANAAYVTLGTSNAVAATLSDDVIQPNSWMSFTVGSNTYLAAITATGTASLNISGGAGLATGAGGGSGGSGGSGAITSPLGVNTIANSVTVTPATSASWTVAQGTASNLNATVVGTGTFATQLTGATNNINNISGTVTLPTGAATAALQTTGNSALSTINTTLGSPFQVNGAISNTGFNALQGGTVVSASNPTFTALSIAGAVDSVNNPIFVSPGNGATWAVTQSGTWNLTNISGTVSLPTNAAQETGGNLATLAGGVSSSVYQENLKQVNGVTVLTGTGSVGTGSQRVAVGQDGNTIAGSAVGTAGSASTNVVTVQGIASGTVVPISGTVTANAGTNLNTSTLATSANQPTAEAFAGTSSTGTTGTMAFGASTTGAPTYTTGSNWPLSLTPVGNLRVDGSSVTQPVSGTVTANAGTNLNTSALATSANQTNASQKTQIVDGSGNVIASTSNNLDVQCANCSGSGVSTADEASYTAGVSLFAGGGGFYQTTATTGALTNGQQGMFQVTAQRALFTNLRNSSGTEIATSGAPLRTDPTGATTQPVSGTVTANAGTNLNTSTLALESGGNLATLAGGVSSSVYQENLKQVNGVTVLTGTGATGTGAQRVTVSQDANTIAGSAVGTAGSASTNVVTVQGIASGTVVPISGTVTANAGTNLNTSTLATSANQTNAAQKTQIVDGSGNVIASTSNNLDVQCANCSGSGVSSIDEASYTAGASLFAGGGGFYQTTATTGALTNGQQGMFQVTAQRALFTNLRNSSGAELSTSSNPVIITPYIAGAVNSATNGTYENLLQGNAVLSATNPLPITPEIAGAVNSATNGLYVNLLQGNAALASGNPIFVNCVTGCAAGSTSNATSGVATSSTNAATVAYNYGFNGTTWDQLQVDASKYLKVNVETGAVTVSGTATVTQGTAASSGPWIMTPWIAGAVNSVTNGLYINLLQGNAVLSSGNPIFATLEGTVPLPTGASTSALQPTSNAVAGTSTTGTTGTLMFGAATTGAPTDTTGSNWPLSLDTVGNLRVNCTAGCSGSVTANAFAGTSSAGTTGFGVYGASTTSAPTYTAGSNWPLSLTPVGNLRVDGSSVTQPISGAVTVSGTATVTQGTAAASGPWIMTPWIAGAVNSATNGLYINLLQGNAVIASGNPVFAQLTAGSATIGALTANQSVNVAQVNGVTTLTGAGAVGTGSQRVAVGQDVTTLAGTAPASITTPAAPPGGGGPVMMAVATTAAVGSLTTTDAYALNMTTSSALREDLSSVNSVAVLTGTGASGTGSQRVTVAGDTATIAGSAPGTAGSASSNVVTVQGVASMTKLLVTPDSVALPANQSVNVSQIAGVAPVNDACATVAHVYTPIATTATAKIISGTSAKKTYICSIFLFAGAADNVSVIEGTGTTCGTSTVAVIGSTTAAAGLNLAANQGFVAGAGSNAIAATSVNADDLCLIVSAASQLSGSIVTVQQ